MPAKFLKGNMSPCLVHQYNSNKSHPRQDVEKKSSWMKEKIMCDQLDSAVWVKSTGIFSTNKFSFIILMMPIVDLFHK